MQFPAQQIKNTALRQGICLGPVRQLNKQGDLLESLKVQPGDIWGIMVKDMEVNKAKQLFEGFNIVDSIQNHPAYCLLFFSF